MEEKKIDVVRAVRGDPLIRLTEETAARTGSSLVLVGGWLRDLYLGERSQDYDFIVEGDAAALAQGISRSLGAAWFRMGHQDPPNYRVAGPAFSIDLVPQHPEGLARELLRRDFTINAIAFSFFENQILDPLEGRRDIRNRTVRIASPGVLDADPLRMLRAVRFVTVLKGFTLSDETVSEIKARADRLSESASERVREEMDRIMVSGRGRAGLSLMADLGLLPVVFPEVLPLRGLDQGPHHHLDAFQHTLQTIGEVDDLASLTGLFAYPFHPDREDRLVLSYAALLHDIGKAGDRTEDETGIIHFYGHEKTGAETAGGAMKRLCFPAGRTDRVKRLIRHHVSGLGLIQDGYTPRALRRVLRRLGYDLPLHVLLFMSDRRAARGGAYREKEKKTVGLGQALLDLYREEGEGILNLPCLVGGEDVMGVLGIPPGPAVGEVLEKVRSLQVDQEIRSREEALSFLHRLREDPGGQENMP